MRALTKPLNERKTNFEPFNFDIDLIINLHIVNSKIPSPKLPNHQCPPLAQALGINVAPKFLSKY